MKVDRETAKARHTFLTIDRYLSVPGELFHDSHIRFLPGLQRNLGRNSAASVVFYNVETPGKLILCTLYEIHECKKLATISFLKKYIMSTAKTRML